MSSYIIIIIIIIEKKTNETAHLLRAASQPLTAIRHVITGCITTSHSCQTCHLGLHHNL